MTVDEKITRLQESAMQEARSKGNAIVEQHKKALTHVFEQHKAEALIQADTRIKAEKTSVKPVSYTHLDVYKRQAQSIGCYSKVMNV